MQDPVSLARNSACSCGLRFGKSCNAAGLENWIAADLQDPPDLFRSVKMMSVEFCVLVGLPATSRGGKDQVAGEPIPTGGRPQRARLPLHLCPRSTRPPEIRAVVTFNHASYCSFLAQAARAGQAHRRLYVWVAPPRECSFHWSLTLVGTPQQMPSRSALALKVSRPRESSIRWYVFRTPTRDCIESG